MVLLAAAICNKAGKVLLSRQFVEMQRTRIEGLLAAFGKLVGGGSSSKKEQAQHTFIETDSVRYIYQPIEKLFVVLITSKASNILEDLETLRLFARVVPEYSRGLDEKEIVESAFQLIFAFDEIVALGYRESVNLQQVRTFVEADSQEEKLALSVRLTQEREAKQRMREKAKELSAMKRDVERRGGKFGYSGGISSSSMGSGGSSGSLNGSQPTLMDTDRRSPDSGSMEKKPQVAAASTGKALKLGAKTKDADAFLTQLKQEGEKVSLPSSKPTGAGAAAAATGAKAAAADAQRSAVSVSVAERVNAQIGRTNDVRSFEVLGIVTLRINEEVGSKAGFRCDTSAAQQRFGNALQFQTHPNIDKRLFATDGTVRLKSDGAGQRSYPIGQELGVVKWRLASTASEVVPVTVNCWPNAAPSRNGFEVNIEYELNPAFADDETDDGRFELRDVRFEVRLPVPFTGSPVVSSCDGEYRVDTKRALLIWTVPLIDARQRSGALEFALGGCGTSQSTADGFFPIHVAFTSSRSFCPVRVSPATNESGQPLKTAIDTSLTADNYEIV